MFLLNMIIVYEKPESYKKNATWGNDIWMVAMFTNFFVNVADKARMVLCGIKVLGYISSAELAGSTDTTHLLYVLCLMWYKWKK